MKKSRFTETQIVKAIKAHEAGRKELLNANVFNTLEEVREKAMEWIENYNRERPHESLGYKAPMELLEQL